MPLELTKACELSADLYRRIGYDPPWVGYISVDDGRPVGGGAFVGAPREGVVEIAYFTLAEFMNRGYATQTATHLVAIARRTVPGITVKAFTLPQAGASTKVLERLGFKVVGHANDVDAGEVWEWRA
jgi:RimJ/RimL family protein N-acetyltransferase